MNKSLSDNHENMSADCRYDKALISAYADDELTQQQRQHLEVHVKSCASCRQTLEEWMQMKAIIKERRTPDLEAEQIDALLNDTGSKISQGLAWSAIIIALSIAAAFGVYEFYLESSISWSEKLLASLLWGGIIGLFLSVVRQQLKARKTDKYKKVKL